MSRAVWDRYVRWTRRHPWRNAALVGSCASGLSLLLGSHWWPGLALGLGLGLVGAWNGSPRCAPFRSRHPWWSAVVVSTFTGLTFGGLAGGSLRAIALAFAVTLVFLVALQALVRRKTAS